MLVGGGLGVGSWPIPSIHLTKVSWCFVGCFLLLLFAIPLLNKQPAMSSVFLICASAAAAGCQHPLSIYHQIF
jgi:hypothetical protein